jgi:peptidoglycan hydrolase CwlO-like protein
MKRLTLVAIFLTALHPLIADEVENLPATEQTAEPGAAKQHIEQLDQKLQQLFSKIKTLQEEREQLEAMIEAKEDQLEALQEEVVVVLKQRDFYEQELGSPEDEPSAPYQP